MSPARGMDPEAFRAQATGIGQTAQASRATGAARAQRVVDQTDPACRAIWPGNEGFPMSTADRLALPLDLLPVPNRDSPDSQPGQPKDLAKRLT
jgi:hypothetical protein